MKSKRRYMVGERPSIIGLFQVTAKPASKLRRILYDIIPYWQGSQPEFTFYFEALIDIEHKCRYLCDIQYSTGKIPKLAPWEFSLPEMKRGGKWETTVGKMHLINTGDTFLRVAEVTGTKTNPELEYKSVFLFHVTSRSWLFLALVAGILAGVLSILGSWLSSCFF